MRAKWAARGAAVLLGLVVIFQIAVAAGAPWGAVTQGGANPGVLPPPARLVAALSTVLLIVMALGLLGRVGEGPLAASSRRPVAVIAWFATVYAGVGLMVNLITPSAAERAIWAPVSALILVCALIVMTATRRSRGSHDRPQRH